MVLSISNYDCNVDVVDYWNGIFADDEEEVDNEDNNDDEENKWW